MTAPVRPSKRITTTPPVKKTLPNAPVFDEGVTEVSPGVFEVPDEDEGSRIEERPPVIPTPTVSERLNGVRDRARIIPNRLSKMVPTKTKTSKPRVSVADLISTVWDFGARALKPTVWPVANVLTLQSPVAGAILEESVKNTVADTLLQPFARFAKGSDVVIALLGPPVLVGIACANPKSQPFVEPLLRQALRTWLTVAGPKMIEAAEKEAEFQKEYGSTIDDMIKMIFTPPEGMVIPNVSVPDTA